MSTSSPLPIERLRSLLACPDCRTGLESQPSGRDGSVGAPAGGPAPGGGAAPSGASVAPEPSEVLRCPECGQRYPVLEGVPQFLDRLRYDEAVGRFESLPGTGLLSKQGDTGGLRGLLLRYPLLLGPPIARDADGAQRWERVASLFREVEGLGMNLGSQGTAPLPDLVSFDADRVPGVELVGDAHHIPLLGDSLGLVVTTSVFEHLQDPRKAIAEVFRVLAPGGILYFEVPWMYEIHGCPADYQRWTPMGLRILMEDFEILDDGPIGGPASVTARMIRGLLFSVTPGRHLRYLVRILATWLLFWMKYLDAWIPADRRTPFAQGFWILARKPRSPGA